MMQFITDIWHPDFADDSSVRRRRRINIDDQQCVGPALPVRRIQRGDESVFFRGRRIAGLGEG